MDSIEGLGLGMEQIVFLLVLAVVLVAVQIYFGRKRKAKEGLILLVVPFVISILAVIYAFFFIEYPDGGRFMTVFSYFIRVNIITVMLAAIYSMYFGMSPQELKAKYPKQPRQNRPSKQKR